MEEECVLTNNMTYLFLTYRLNSTTFLDIDKYNVLGIFLEQKSFITGLCVVNECYNFYTNFFDPVYNKQLYDKLENHYGIFELSLYNMNYFDKNNVTLSEKQMKENTNKIKNYFIWTWILTLYFSFRCIVTLFCHLIIGINLKMLNGYGSNRMNSYIEIRQRKLSLGDNLGSKGDDLGPQVESQYKLEYSSENEIKSNILKSKESTDKDFNKGTLYKFCKIFSLIKSVKIIFSSNNKYYDDSNLEMFRGYRFFQFVLIIFNSCIRTTEYSPHKHLSDYSLYRHFTFFLVKYSSYSLISFTILNGIYVGFKLMSYYKKHGCEFNLKEMLIFISNFIPSVFIFFFSFFFLHNFIREIRFYIIGNSSVFEYFLYEKISSKKCLENPLSLFIPFYISYFKKSSDNNFLYCFKYTYMVISEFYCFIFFIILFYILNKIKSKILDKCVFLLNFLSIILCYFYYGEIPQKYYSVSSVMGEAYTIKKPHIYFLPYFLGINVGIMWFYFNDITTPLPIVWNINKYTPLQYNFYIMKYFDKTRNRTKLLITLLTSLSITLLCFSFTFIIWINSKCFCIKDILVEYTLTIRILFIYEGKIFILLEILLIILILFYNRESLLKRLLSSKLFIAINRISLTFLCSYDIIIYTFFTYCNAKNNASIQDSLLLTLAFIAFIFIFTCLLVVIIELPFKMIYLANFRKYETNKESLNLNYNFTKFSLDSDKNCN